MYYVVGCGIVGSVIARRIADDGNHVTIVEKRDHIGGNLFDYHDGYGILVQKYGPHVFHTNDELLVNYLKKYESWDSFNLKCGAQWDGKTTPSPFNFKTIDIFFSPDIGDKIKKSIKDNLGDKETITVLEALNHSDEMIRLFAQYLFSKDYAPYTAKQWGVEPESIDPSVLRRVPIVLSYREGYFDDKYQLMPSKSYTQFFNNLLSHRNIKLMLNTDASEIITINDKKITIDGDDDSIIIYTGALDSLFDYCYGKLPYRSLKFELFHKEESFLDYPVVAFPQERGYTRITDYSQLPLQKGKGTTYAVEYPYQYENNGEPFYPVLTEESKELYLKYSQLADSISNLRYCGRLADYKYYNMDEALKRALLFDYN